jgi:hypothetical protein
MTFRLDSTEMAQLIQQAPQELKNIFGADSLQEDVEEISFDYRSVALTRPWFHPELLQARFWRLPDGAPFLSDGGSPAKGSMPAYVSALVLVRNIQVRTSAAPKNDPPAYIRALPAFVFQTTPAMRGQQHLVLAAGPRTPSITPSVNIAAAPQPSHPALFMLAPIKVATASDAARPAIHIQQAASLRIPEPVVTPQPVQLPPSNAAVPASVTEDAQPARQQPTQSTAQSTDISILAFICRRVGKCPDPDPALNWAANP